MDFMMRYGCFSMTHNDSAMSSGGLELLTLNLDKMSKKKTKLQEPINPPLLIASVMPRLLFFLILMGYLIVNFSTNPNNSMTIKKQKNHFGNH